MARPTSPLGNPHYAFLKEVEEEGGYLPEDISKFDESFPGYDIAPLFRNGYLQVSGPGPNLTELGRQFMRMMEARVREPGY